MKTRGFFILFEDSKRQRLCGPINTPAPGTHRQCCYRRGIGNPLSLRSQRREGGTELVSNFSYRFLQVAVSFLWFFFSSVAVLRIIKYVLDLIADWLFVSDSNGIRFIL